MSFRVPPSDIAGGISGGGGNASAAAARASEAAAAEAAAAAAASIDDVSRAPLRYSQVELPNKQCPCCYSPKGGLPTELISALI